MKKIELTKDKIKALKASVKHWERDMCREFAKGRAAFDDGEATIRWRDNRRMLKIGSKHCALCVRFLRNVVYCHDCPYAVFYEISCVDSGSHYDKFCDNPCLRTANAMKNALVRILKAGGVEA